LTLLNGRDGLAIRHMEVTYFVGRERLLVTRRHSGMARWRERIFVLMGQNAQSATRFFRLPANRVVVLGGQVEI